VWTAKYKKSGPFFSSLRTTRLVYPSDISLSLHEHILSLTYTQETIYAIEKCVIEIEYVTRSRGGETIGKKMLCTICCAKRKKNKMDQERKSCAKGKKE
jgi:hypothetical protein